MDSRPASRPQQVGSRLRRSLCSDRRMRASDLSGTPRRLLNRHPPVSQGPWAWHMLLVQGSLVPAPGLDRWLCRQRVLWSSDLVWGPWGLRFSTASLALFIPLAKRKHSKPATATDRHENHDTHPFNLVRMEQWRLNKGY